MNRSAGEGDPILTAEEREGMLDFLSVYEAYFDQIATRLFEVAGTLPGLGKALPRMSAQQIEENGRSSRAVIRSAIVSGKWGPLLETRRSQGRMYASFGVSFKEWFEIFSHFESLLIGYLVEAFGAEPARLSAALRGMNRYVHLGMSAITEAYVAAVEHKLVWRGQSAPGPAPN